MPAPWPAAVFAASLLVTGCGRINYEPQLRDGNAEVDAMGDASDARADAPADSASVDAADGARDADATTDGSSDASDGDSGLPACDWTLPFVFSGIELVEEINTAADERGVRIKDDHLTINFQSDRKGGAGASDIYRGTRTSTSGPFSGFVPISGVNSAASESSAWVSHDERELFVATDRGGGPGSSDIWRFTRTLVELPFGAAESLLNVNTIDAEYDPFVDFDGLTLYWSGRRATVGSEIIRARRLGFGEPFADVTVESVLGSTAGEGNPSLTADGRVIVYNSSRLGVSALYFARRGSRDTGWEAPQEVPGVNTEGGEHDPFVTADGCALYFVRVSATTAGDIYRAYFTLS